VHHDNLGGEVVENRGAAEASLHEHEPERE
jgi:hypothetical protein